jgi:hypothetical protein
MYVMASKGEIARELRESGLSAAPTFAMMALLTYVLGDGAPGLLCTAAHISPLGGMMPMYLLMSAFHSAPWLKLFSRRRPDGCAASAEIPAAEL